MKGLCCFSGLGGDPGQDSDPLRGNFSLDGGSDVTVQQFRCQYASRLREGPCCSSGGFSIRTAQGDGNKHGKFVSRNKSAKVRRVEREVPGVAHGSRKTVPQNWYRYYCHRMGEIPTGVDEPAPRAALGTSRNDSRVCEVDEGRVHQCIRAESPINEHNILESDLAGIDLVASGKGARYLPDERSDHQTFTRREENREPPYIPPLDFRRLPGYVNCHPNKPQSPTGFLDPPVKLAHLRHEFTLRWIRDEEDDIVAELKDSSGLTPVWQSPNIIDLFSSQISPACVEEDRTNSMTESLKSFGEELVFNMMSPVPCFRNSCPKTRRPVGSKSSHQGSYSMAASDSVSTYAPEDELADMIAMQSILSGTALKGYSLSSERDY